MLDVKLKSYDDIFKDSILTSRSEVKKEDAILTIGTNPYNHRAMYTLGNISTVMGKAKSRKTFYISMLLASVINSGYFQDRILSKMPFNNHAVMFDTEQGLWDSKEVLMRILRLNGYDNESNILKWFHLRKENPDDRNNFIQEYIEKEHPAFIVIDGIRDLVTDINEQSIAVEIVGNLMRLSEEFNCHICSVIHQNPKDEKARGWLGTELMNKSESVVEVSKLPDDKSISVVRPIYMRKEEFEPIYFKIINSLPTIIDYDEPQSKKKLI